MAGARWRPTGHSVVDVPTPDTRDILARPPTVAVEVSLDGESRYSDTHELTYGGNCERATLDLDFTIRSR